MLDNLTLNQDPFVNLTYFIRQEQKKHDATGRFTNILLNIALGTKIVSTGVNKAGVTSMLGGAGQVNVQGEDVQKLDIYADEVFNHVLGRSGEFISMVSEERESMHKAEEGEASSRYVIAFDPLDGSSNIDVNVSIGTIWGIYRRVTEGSSVDVNNPVDFYQAGAKQVAAGYTIYGSSTMFVFTTGDGVHGFTLDPNIGEFILTHRNITIPESGKIYSCNTANYPHWSLGIRNYIDKLQSGKKGQYSQRYVGSLVADIHRTLLKGGIFMYPGDSKNKNGKLRLLYECAPMAMIVEQAGGRASNGAQDILSIQAKDIHQRMPLIIGSREMVSEAEECIQNS